MSRRELSMIARRLVGAAAEVRRDRKALAEQRRSAMKLLDMRLDKTANGYEWKDNRPKARLVALKAQFRADGYRPVARYGKGEYLHEDGYRMRTVRFDPVLGWIWITSISRSLLIRSARQAVAARG